MLANRPSDFRYSSAGGSAAIEGTPLPSRWISTQADQLWPPGLLIETNTISIRFGCSDGRFANAHILQQTDEVEDVAATFAISETVPAVLGDADTELSWVFPFVKGETHH